VLHTLVTITKDNWRWRKQIGRLAVFDLMKQSRGAVLSWAWLLIKPAIFMFVFWFALEIGFKQGDPNAYPPYFLWLMSGVIPWFYMRDILSTGSDVLRRFPYLVNKLKFPLSAISTIFCLSNLVVHVALMLIVFVIYLAFGVPLDLHLLQVPVIIICMFVFFTMFSILCSQLSALSKDFAFLLKSLVTPLFWLSGILFNVNNLDASLTWIKTVLLFNPITFFAYAFRDALYERVWVWENPVALEVFAGIFVVTLLAMLIVYKRFHEEVHDAF